MRRASGSMLDVPAAILTPDVTWSFIERVSYDGAGHDACSAGHAGGWALSQPGEDSPGESRR